MNLYLDDCSHCACITHLVNYTPEQAIKELEKGSLGCHNCEEDDDGHHTCVVFYEGDKVLWDGRCEV